MYILDGKIIRKGQAFSHNEVNYPENWNFTDEELVLLGAEKYKPEQRVSIPMSDRFYWTAINSEGNYERVPKNINDVKKVMISEVKQAAASLLSETDWYVVRKLETNQYIPINITEYRNNIRLTCTSLVDSINFAMQIEELEVITYNWPQI